LTLNGDLAACAGAADGEEEAARFWYYDASVAGGVTSIYPSAGPAGGGTEITVMAMHLRSLGSSPSDALHCLFGEPAETHVLVLAVLLNGQPLESSAHNATDHREPLGAPPAFATGVRCISPPSGAFAGTSGGSLPFSVALRVVMNPADPQSAATATSVQFSYFDV